MARLWFTSCWVLALMCSGAFQLANAGSNSNTMIRATVLHRDHPESPFSVSGASAADRYRAATARQQARYARRSLAPVAAPVEFNASIGNALTESSDEYIVTLYVGTPAVQKFFLIMDTGSDLVWVQCLPCILCFNGTNPPFNSSASSSYSAASCSSTSCNNTLLGGQGAFCNSLSTCEIQYAYAQSGSGFEGVLSTETMAFDNTSAGISNILFGCMNNNTASFGQVDGLLGFGRGAFSFPSQLTALSSIDVFSYCLVPFTDAATLTSSLVFGAPASTNLQLTYTPILDIGLSATFYWVDMTGISINDMALDIASSSLKYNSTSLSGGTIFDSGTTVLIFAQDIYTTVTENLKSLITYPIVIFPNSSDICFNTSGVQDILLPNMTLHFSGLDATTTSDLELADKNLVLVGGEDVYCLAIAAGGAPGSVASFNYVGNVAQADHYVETDLINKRIGWVTRDCSIPI